MDDGIIDTLMRNFNFRKFIESVMSPEERVAILRSFQQEIIYDRQDQVSPEQAQDLFQRYGEELGMEFHFADLNEALQSIRNLTRMEAMVQMELKEIVEVSEKMGDLSIYNKITRTFPTRNNWYENINVVVAMIRHLATIKNLAERSGDMKVYRALSVFPPDPMRWFVGSDWVEEQGDQRTAKNMKAVSEMMNRLH